MPHNKSLNIPAEFVDKVLDIISNESEAGRKRLVSLSRRAEENYKNPGSWITGWIYQYTRLRGGKVMQSIKVMEDFPDAFTRLQEFKLLISEGEWNVSSYNFLLFHELIKEVPEYEPLEEELLHAFILQLKELVMKQMDIFMSQYKASLVERKTLKTKREVLQYSGHQLKKDDFVLGQMVLDNATPSPSDSESSAEDSQKSSRCINTAFIQRPRFWQQPKVVEEIQIEIPTLSND